MHTTQTKSKILNFIKEHEQASNQELRVLTGITQVGVSKHLAELVKQGKIIPQGQHPNS